MEKHDDYATDYPNLGGVVFKPVAAPEVAVTPSLYGNMAFNAPGVHAAPVVTGLPSLEVGSLVALAPGQYPSKFIVVNDTAIRKSFQRRLISQVPVELIGQFSELFGRTLRDEAEAAYHIEAYNEAGGDDAVIAPRDGKALAEAESEHKQLRVRFGDVTLDEGRRMAIRYDELQREREDTKRQWRALVAGRAAKVAELRGEMDLRLADLAARQAELDAYRNQLEAWYKGAVKGVDDAVAAARLAKDEAKTAWDFRRWVDD